jgi:hypothetical protein
MEVFKNFNKRRESVYAIVLPVWWFGHGVFDQYQTVKKMLIYFSFCLFNLGRKNFVAFLPEPSAQNIL